MSGPSSTLDPPRSVADLQALLDSLPADRALRLMHMEGDADWTLLLDPLLHTTLPAGSVIDKARDLDHALIRLRSGKYDAVLLDLSLLDGEGAALVQAIRGAAADAPIVVLTGQESPGWIKDVQHQGAARPLFQSHLSGDFLDELLRRAIQQRRAAGVSPAAESPCYLTARAAVVIPLLTDHRPGPPLAATTTDLSRERAELLVDLRELPTWDRLVLGLERDDGTFCYATAAVRQRHLPAAGCRLSVSFVAPADDPLSTERLALRFDPVTFRMVAGLPQSVLHAWAQLGVVRPYVIDRLRVCHRCAGLPTFRDGCRACGSVRTSSVQYIHHFACAHVAPAIDFDGDARLACPKCRARNLIVGSDFEYLSGPIRCLDCTWSGTQLTSIAECLKCGLRFLGSEAPQIDVIQFHVERLDPLAFV